MSKYLKKQNGVFYTNLFNPFRHDYFIKWANKISINSKTILEPFAGANHIITLLKSINCCNNFVSFDIDPKDKNVLKQDTIINFPKGYSVCITNPPWLYKSRAKRLKLIYPDTKWDNLYKHCLSLCLENCNYIAVLIPASFISSNIFLDRLDSVIVLNARLFTDTENPVCLALFNKEKVLNTKIFIDDKYIGELSKLKENLPKKKNINISFNEPKGDLGLVAIDNTKEASIRFCKGEELTNYNIRNSSRSITRISIDGVKIEEELIIELNQALNNFRVNTNDIFMTAFKGIRADGYYRRRLDYSLARKLITDKL